MIVLLRSARPEKFGHASVRAEISTAVNIGEAVAVTREAGDDQSAKVGR